MFELALFSFSSLHWIFDRDEDGDLHNSSRFSRDKSWSIPLFKQMEMVNYNSVISRTQEKYRNSHASSEQRGSGQSEQSGHGNYKHLGFKWKMVQKRNRNLAGSKIQKCGIQNFERV